VYLKKAAGCKVFSKSISSNGVWSLRFVFLFNSFFFLLVFCHEAVCDEDDDEDVRSVGSPLYLSSSIQFF
jgi:hypothetical protein